MDVPNDIAGCRICEDRFAATHTAHEPRPVVWFRPGVRILVCGQAPGVRVHEAGMPFWDRSGDRLRDWLGIGESVFYDQDLLAIIPMAFCFPGYDAKGSDLPPPKICAATWRKRALNHVGDVPLTILIGGYAQKWHLGDGAKGGVTETVRRWRDHAPGVFSLPHPSWRNNAWVKRNPWFSEELLPALQARVRDVLA